MQTKSMRRRRGAEAARIIGAMMTGAIMPLLLAGTRLPVRAEIVLGGRDSAGAMDNSGTNKNPAPLNLSQYTGQWGGFLGTPIAPHYFVTANHLGNAGGGTFSFANGTATTTNYAVSLAGTMDDLAIWKITGAGAFGLYAPVFYGADEAGQSLVSIGNGTTRGGAITQNGQLAGWQDGAGGTLRSWQANRVDSVVQAQDIGAPGGFGGDYLAFSFHRDLDAQGNLLDPDAGIFSGGDSGGPTFVLDPSDNAYKLAGINSLVDTVNNAPNSGPFTAALFDARGFYSGPDLITDASPVPLSSYATRLSSRQDFIRGTLGVEAVPEPGVVGLCAGLGVTGLLLWRKRAKTPTV